MCLVFIEKILAYQEFVFLKFEHSVVVLFFCLGSSTKKTIYLMYLNNEIHRIEN